MHSVSFPHPYTGVLAGSCFGGFRARIVDQQGFLVFFSFSGKEEFQVVQQEKNREEESSVCTDMNLLLNVCSFEWPKELD